MHTECSAGVRSDIQVCVQTAPLLDLCRMSNGRYYADTRPIGTRLVGTRRTETASGWTRLIGTRLTESRLVGMTPLSKTYPGMALSYPPPSSACMQSVCWVHF